MHVHDSLNHYAFDGRCASTILRILCFAWGNFIMQVVDIQAFSVMFAARSIPDSWSRIYRGIMGLLREFL